jgi:peptide chain release factor 1
MNNTPTQEKPLLFSLSKAKGDFVVTPFKGSGKGGQKRNKTMSCCRISHPASGAVAECQDERSFEQNKKRAFRRLLEKPEFVRWHKIETSRRLGLLANVDEEVEREMNNIRVEVMQDGKWREV